MIDRTMALFILAWACVKGCVKGLIKRYVWSPAHKPATRDPKMYLVYVFNEGHGPGFHVPGFYKEISLQLFDPETWETDVREMTGWFRFRVEVRYTYRHKKYRLVLRPGDRCPFPMYAEPTAPPCRLPKGVLSARLQGAVGSSIDCDVTHRILKYQGPLGDFHAGLGLTVKVQDMFPFDDQADNSARFTHLRIMDTSGRLHDIPYDTNPCVTLKSG